jgi:HK97 family phage major capsid protein
VSTSTKIREELKAKRAEASSAWAVFEPLRDQINTSEFKANSDEGKALVAKAHEASVEYSKLSEECKSLEAAYDQALEMDGVAAPSKSSPFDTESKDAEFAAAMMSKTPGERMVGDEGYEEFRKTVMQNGAFRWGIKGLSRDEHIAQIQSRYGVKTLLQSGSPTATSTNQGTLLVQPTRLPGYVELLQAPLKLRNLITVGATDTSVIEWIQQTAVASAAAEVAEATATSGSSGTKPESAMSFSLQHTNTEIIAHYIPTTRAALADMAQLRTLIDNQLVEGVARRLNTQILKGDGNAPNLKGILANTIQSQDDVVNGITAARKIERIMAAITKIRLAFLEPTAVLLHPNDYQEIRLAKDAMGQYYFGPPSQAGEATIWGLPMIEDVTVDQGSPVVGDWKQAVLYVQEDVSLYATDSHSDWFVRNMIAVLAEGRYALAVPRPDAFCEVDFSTDEKASTGWS